MSHKIVIMSPLHNLGATVASLMIAQFATFDNKTTNLIFTRPRSNLPTYLGLANTIDPTRSVMQIVKLIDNGAIEDTDILDYTHTYYTNAHLLDVADPSLSGRDRDQVISHIFARVPTDLSICDNSEDIDTSVSQKLIEMADMIFIVMDMSRKSREYVKEWLETPQLKKRSNVFFIVNRYHEVVCAVRNFAKIIGQPASRVCKIHYNPWIEKCCNNSQFQTLLPLAHNLDPRVASLNNDLAEIMMAINSSIFFSDKRGS